MYGTSRPSSSGTCCSSPTIRVLQPFEHQAGVDSPCFYRDREREEKPDNARAFTTETHPAISNDERRAMISRLEVPCNWTLMGPVVRSPSVLRGGAQAIAMRSSDSCRSCTTSFVTWRADSSGESRPTTRSRPPPSFMRSTSVCCGSASCRHRSRRLPRHRRPDDAADPGGSRAGRARG